MRVLIYADAFYPSIGGIEHSTAMIAKHLHEQGVTVVVVTRTPSPVPEPFPYRVVRNPSNGQLTELVRQADLVHMNNYHVGLFLRAKLRRRKIVCTYRDLSMICPKSTKWKVDGPCLHPAGVAVCVPCLRTAKEPVARRLARPVAKAALSFLIHANVCTSPFGLRRFPLWRKRLIPNGVDTSFFLPAPDRSSPEILTVLMVARLIPEKGALILLESLRICAQSGARFRVSLCGVGPELRKLEAWTRANGIQEWVTFHGPVQGEALLDVMHRSNIAVVPSLWDEPFGLTAVEAMSCGLPVVASDVGGLGDVVREAGLVFARGDAGALAAHLRRLLGDRSLREQLGRNAREVAVRKYDIGVMAGAYFSLYRELLGAAR